MLVEEPLLPRAAAVTTRAKAMTGWLSPPPPARPEVRLLPTARG
jgi:hypothetical protein